MAQWEKIKFFWKTMLGSVGSTLTASSTAQGFDVKNIYNMLERDMWKAANAASPIYITYDAGAGNTVSADYFAILGHNLATVGASVTLQRSSDGFISDIKDVVSFNPASDKVILEDARLIVNGGFEVWSNGTNSTPDGWTLYGDGTVARNSNYVLEGSFSAYMTYGTSGATYLQQLIPNHLDFAGETYSVGCMVRSDTPNNTFIEVNDSDAVRSYHTATGSWQWVTVTKTIKQSPSWLGVYAVIEGPGFAYLDNLVIKKGTSVSPDDVSDLVLPSSNYARYWRLKITGHTIEPYMAICIWGLKTELDYVSAGFDPYEEEIKANVTRSDTGYVLGVHDRYRERRMTLRFEDADDDLYQKIKDWWDGNGLKNFFVAWERGNKPDDVFLMMPEPKFNNPFKMTGRRDIAISLVGRRE